MSGRFSGGRQKGPKTKGTDQLSKACIVVASGAALLLGIMVHLHEDTTLTKAGVQEGLFSEHTYGMEVEEHVKPRPERPLTVPREHLVPKAGGDNGAGTSRTAHICFCGTRMIQQLGKTVAGDPNTVPRHRSHVRSWFGCVALVP